MKVHCTAHGAAREPGRESEDAFRVVPRDACVIAALADGLGGARLGGAAARRAVAMVTDYYLGRPQSWSPRRALTEFAGRINRVFFQESQLHHGSPELLCTLSVIAIEGGMLYGLNVGDSPVFIRRRRAKLTRVSENHTHRDNGMEHVLTRAVGATAELEPHVFETSVENGDVILLCSDGVSTPLGDETLDSLIASGLMARNLVAAAHQTATGRPELQDDASAVLLEVQDRGWRDRAADRTVEVLEVLRAGMAIDDLELERPLQPGDRVWLARRTNGRREVLKFPSLDARDDDVRRDAFVREAWQAVRLDAPGFPRARLPDEGTLRYYAMEYVDAPTLRATLTRHTLAVEDAVALGKFLLGAGQTLLRNDVVHGDIKPENVLIVRDANDAVAFTLLDLGSAAEIFSITTRAGTASYLAPERFRGGALSERTEIFAIGVTLYEALTRSYPYGEIERFQTPGFENPPKRISRLNPAVPAWLEAVIARALSPEPERRYQSFSEMAFDLAHPEKVEPFYRRDTPLLERNPLLFYKVLCGVLLGVSIALAMRLLMMNAVHHLR